MERTLLQKHVRRRQIELALTLDGKRAIYLDTKFWIILRDVALGRRTEKGDIRLRELLADSVLRGKAFCPISDSTFAELLKQSDANTRKATATLIAELSDGVTLIPLELRVGTELAHFIHSLLGAPSDLFPLKQLVWSKLSYVLGFVHPTMAKLEPESEFVLQREFFDHMWTISILEMMDRIGDAMPSAAFANFEQLAQKLNVENSRHSDEIASFHQAYLAEVQGVIDVYAGTAVEIIQTIADARRGYSAELSDEERSLEHRFVRNLLFQAFKKDKTKDALRTMHTMACIHALVRWNKTKKLKATDFFDFRHAAAAVGYCDAFLTERAMRTVLTSKPLSLDSRFGCRVMAQTDDAIDYLNSLVNE